jgi:hypothetical protein
MANIYVRSTDGNNVDDGSTWALAKADLAGAAAIDAAGDVIYVSQAHSESTAAAVSYTWSGTRTAPTRVFGANDGAEPPTAMATSPIVATTGASNLQLNVTTAVSLHVHGIQFTAGDGANTANITLNSVSAAAIIFDSCLLYLRGTGSAGVINTGSGRVVLRDCTVRFSAAGHSLSPSAGIFHWIGGGFHASTTQPTNLFNTMSAGGRVLLDGVDLSAGASTMNIAASNTAALIAFVMRNCKLPASWSGTLNNSAGQGSRFSMYNCDSGDTNYRLLIKDGNGDITSETTLVRSGGASDGTTSLSWKLTSNTNALWEHQPLYSDEIVRWQDAVGGSITATIEILHDSATPLTDKDVWLEVQYLGTSGVPLGAIVTDAAADYLATAANQTTSSVTWTTTGMSNPNKQKLSVTFTPQEKGYLIARVALAKASYTVYVCPKMDIT